MELNIDVLEVAWRHIPALIAALTVLASLANESRQQKRLVNNFNFYSTHR
jgi:hypothetical protein